MYFCFVEHCGDKNTDLLPTWPNVTITRRIMQTDGYTEKLWAGQLPHSDSVHYVIRHGKMFHAHESQMKSDWIRKQKTRRKRNRRKTRSKAKRRKAKTSK